MALEAEVVCDIAAVHPETAGFERIERDSGYALANSSVPVLEPVAARVLAGAAGTAEAIVLHSERLA